ncbi:MAG: cation:proton antiporter [Lentisphaeria bacterium]|nr:cation:proton antiporter [Lentisphaeria bacterium]
MLQIGIVIFAAHFAGLLFKKMNIPSVLGELMTGVLLGPYLLGGIHLPIPGFESGLFPLPSADSSIPVCSELYFISMMGSVALLFLSGLETDLKMFLRYSFGGTLIGIGGVVVSFLFGDALGMLLMHAAASDPRCLFLGILCTATSVGITARILSEHHSMETPEGTSIMAAAVIDDVLGIICLAVVMGIIAADGDMNNGINWKGIGIISAKSVLIWLAFTLVCILCAHRLARLLKIFRDSASFAVLGLGLAMFLAGIFERCGLAMIIGAYCAGLGLCRTDIAYSMQDRMRGLYGFLVPIFFVVMGMLVDVRVFADKQTLLFGFLYALLAVLAKVFGCMLPALFMNFNLIGALRIGIGMIPRGEVALIIAGIGATTMMKINGVDSPIINHQLLGVTVIMTLLTTLAAPPLLTFVLKIKKRGVKVETHEAGAIRIPWQTKSRTVRDFLAREVIENFTREGFRHSNYSRDNSVVNFRKEGNSFSMWFTNEPDDSSHGIVLECLKRDEATVRAVFTETIAEIHQVFDKIRRNLHEDKPLFEGLMKKASSIVAYSQDNDMSLEEIIPENCCLTDLQATEYNDALQQLVVYLHRLRFVKDKEMCLKDLMTREQISSTMLDNGTALPHVRTTQVTRMVSVVALCHGMSPDNKTLLIVLTLCPKNDNCPYMQYVAHTASVLLSISDMDAVRALDDATQLRKLFI